MSQVLIVGSGTIGLEYAKVLQALGRSVMVIGRGKKSAEALTAHTGLPVITGGLEAWLDSLEGPPPAEAIVAVPIQNLNEAARRLIRAGVRRLLLEKPGGLTLDEMTALAEEAKAVEAEVYLAYNRRFYAATRKALDIISEDDGVRSLLFEFTEWSHKIVTLNYPPEVLDAWLLANSSHVIDMAFFLCGWPETLCAQVAGKLDWHPCGSAFSGSGTTTSGAVFSYHADWAAPGRWGVEVLTKKHRLIFRPMEQLQYQKIGSVAVEPVEIDYSLDEKFKPGFYLQVKAFLDGPKTDLLRLEEQCHHIEAFYSVIRGRPY